VPIRPFLDRDDVFGPEDIALMSAGYEAALAKLGLVDRERGARCIERRPAALLSRFASA
jgi:hypothetical protein